MSRVSVEGDHLTGKKGCVWDVCGGGSVMICAEQCCLLHPAASLMTLPPLHTSRSLLCLVLLVASKMATCPTSARAGEGGGQAARHRQSGPDRRF